MSIYSRLIGDIGRCLFSGRGRGRNPCQFQVENRIILKFVNDFFFETSKFQNENFQQSSHLRTIE